MSPFEKENIEKENMRYAVEILKCLRRKEYSLAASYLLQQAIKLYNEDLGHLAYKNKVLIGAGHQPITMSDYYYDDSEQEPVSYTRISYTRNGLTHELVDICHYPYVPSLLREAAILLRKADNKSVLDERNNPPVLYERNKFKCVEEHGPYSIVHPANGGPGFIIVDEKGNDVFDVKFYRYKNALRNLYKLCITPSGNEYRLVDEELISIYTEDITFPNASLIDGKIDGKLVKSIEFTIDMNPIKSETVSIPVVAVVDHTSNNIVFDCGEDFVIKLQRSPINESGIENDLAKTILTFVSRKDLEDRLAPIKQWGIANICDQQFFYVKQPKWLRPLDKKEYTEDIYRGLEEVMWDQNFEQFGVFQKGKILAVDYFDLSLIKPTTRDIPTKILTNIVANYVKHVKKISL